ncbi:hypothetical protein WUBG_06705 [Wuchereria bancrofti]|uniref:Uncharacterized protein n=1 Tax=Wuchereria bancrofti TaxID=6293 RepID=J9EYV5_WUCBA|nr:hypothetical protein WUBG_06705 [Wuchereria bancrofti]
MESWDGGGCCVMGALQNMIYMSTIGRQRCASKSDDAVLQNATTLHFKTRFRTQYCKHDSRIFQMGDGPRFPLVYFWVLFKVGCGVSRWVGALRGICVSIVLVVGTATSCISALRVCMISSVACAHFTLLASV